MTIPQKKLFSKNPALLGLIFLTLGGSLFISSWFNTTVTAYLKHLLSFLLMRFIVAFFFFIQSGEFVYDPSRFGFTLWRNTKTIQIILICIFKGLKKLFYDFICFIINHNFYTITFWMHYMLFVIIYGRNKVICYC